MAADVLARRFLHVNLNCASLDATEQVYGEVLGLNARMRTDPKVATDGTILGLDGETFCATSFLYDARGGRGGCALEAIEYFSPALSRDPGNDPARPGIRAAQLGVADVDGVAAALRDAGLTVGEPVEGLIGGGKSVLAFDPDGVAIELTELPAGSDASKGALFNGIRIAAIDAAATGEFLTAIGFDEVDAPKTVPVNGAQLTPGGAGETDCVVARYTLAEDGHQFAVVVVQHPATSPTPVPWGGNRQGLYRCALRVENVHDALAAVPDSVERMGDPVWCPLPGTKIEGLHIAFLRSPDGVVFEFVERPLAYFSR
ncbi:VOC family protein [Mycolicibacterium porcinum]|uniref:VOC family protein n=1 Tax=Mycolicibacterium porcinum TaxID=39693 RepID=A0AAW5SZW9_9MYCO|nr:VOC family protein [Mycolicibacterium porcinum]MCV7388164.1 VOC family protein [Mycolicibacterium porcinum]ORB43330.1 glyoxalase/bleomycin resistance/dioxygenase family protein [Mycolicibacterium porcinum]CDO31151.1 glyoxalase/bleomycin resistance protein/dioxygenase [Mycolicibacterium vulneris]